VDLDVVTFDRVLIVLGFVAAALAALFAYPAWRDSRARPDLRLIASPINVLDVENERGLSVSVAVTIENVGPGTATDWHLTLVSQGSRRIGVMPFDSSPAWRVIDPWEIEWSSSGADDTIGVGLSKHASFLTDRFEPPEGVGVLFALSARRMKSRAGSFHVVVHGLAEAAVYFGPLV